MSKLGVKVLIYQDTEILAKLKEVKEYGFECCQMDIWDTALYTDEKAKEINDAVAETGIEVSSLHLMISSCHVCIDRQRLWQRIYSPFFYNFCPF